MPKKIRVNKDDPSIKAVVEKQIRKISKKREEKSNQLVSMKRILQSKDVKDMFEDIMALSTLPETTKKYIRATIINKVSHSDAVKKIFGSKMEIQEGVITESILNDTAVKNFLDIVKMFYVQITPLAALTEVDIMLNPINDPKVRLAAAKSVKTSAGVSGDEGGPSNTLPVQVVVNMPVQNNTNIQVNNATPKQQPNEPQLPTVVQLT